MKAGRVLATKPNDGRYAELIRQACINARPRLVQAAVAYATYRGVAELCSVLDPVPAWSTARKQWLVGIDFCRSDPGALSHLANLPKSEVRIHDGREVVRRKKCVPRTSFHPKLYIFAGGRKGSVVGSGNLSLTGLRRGVEAGAELGERDTDLLQKWHRSMWREATQYGEIENAYRRRYGRPENLRSPVPTDEDATPASATRPGALSPEDLLKLRACGNLWIDAGKLHENLGKGRPGNQLMLKRNTRVFFGFEARDLARDTAVGTVAMTYRGTVSEDRSLRYSNNSMDVLALPLPGDGGPDAYDGEVLRFRRSGPWQFVLTVGSRTEVREWRRRSREIEGEFAMKGGRSWGVF